MKEKIYKVKIAFYSGTGCTQMVASHLINYFRINNCLVDIEIINSKKQANTTDKYDILILLFPVHTFNAPGGVYEWINDMKQLNNSSAAIISVSGSGEILPNSGCRTGIIKNLENKGYTVTYENMIVMPANVSFQAPEIVNLKLLDVLPKKTGLIGKDILSEVYLRKNPPFIGKIFASLGKIGINVSKFIGTFIKASDECNNCGWCSKNCPSGNIVMIGNKPKFSNKCQLCLKCIYGCPNQGLQLPFHRFIPLSKEFNMKKLNEKLPYNFKKEDMKDLCNGFFFKGVKKYLSENI